MSGVCDLFKTYGLNESLAFEADVDGVKLLHRSYNSIVYKQRSNPPVIWKLYDSNEACERERQAFKILGEYEGIVPGETKGCSISKHKWMKHGTLTDYYGRHGNGLCKPINISLVINIIFQILLILQHFHSLGLLHLDIKPDNIFVVDPINPLFSLGDFDLCHSVKNTDSGTPRGTYPYCSPEATSHQKNWRTSAADVYSVGKTFWEIMTGEDYPEKQILSPDIKALILTMIDKQAEKRSTINTLLKNPVFEKYLTGRRRRYLQRKFTIQTCDRFAKKKPCV